MKRTTVAVDPELLDQVKELYGFATTNEAIHYALTSLAPHHDRRAMLELRGTWSVEHGTKEISESDTAPTDR